MYVEFFPTNKLIWDKKLTVSFQELFLIWSHLFTGIRRPKFIEWVKEFVPEHFDKPLKNLSSQ